MRKHLDRWEERWADTRIHGTTKRQVAVMFAEERLALHPLPLEPFRHYRYGERTVHLDGCVEVEAAYYGAPPGSIGKRIRVQWDTLHVRLLDPQTGQLLREHLRCPRGSHRIKDEDRSRKTPPAVSQLLARADRAGMHLGQLCRTMHSRRSETAVRAHPGCAVTRAQVRCCFGRPSLCSGSRTRGIRIPLRAPVPGTYTTGTGK